MNARPPKVCAVILNVANTPVLQACLRSLERSAYGNFEIIVVHNGPARGGFEAEVRAASSKVREVVFTGFNAGFAAGNNAGIRRAMAGGADYVLLLNDDTEAAPDLLEPLVAAAQSDPSAGLVGPRIFYSSDPGRIWFSGAVFNAGDCTFAFPGSDRLETEYGRNGPEHTDYMTGCAVLVSRKVLEAVGLLDEKFFLYWEDSDWGLRAAAAGFKSLVVPASRLWHKVSASSGGTDSPAKAYYKTRSGLLFAERHAPRARGRMLVKLLRDVAWLLFRSDGPGRFKKAAALLAAVLHYASGRSGEGPSWLAGSDGRPKERL